MDSIGDMHESYHEACDLSGASYELCDQQCQHFIITWCVTQYI